MTCGNCHHGPHDGRCPQTTALSPKGPRICKCEKYVEAPAWDRPESLHQLCLRCGRHESSGAYCSYCRTAEYDLADHEDLLGGKCPLGPRSSIRPGAVLATRHHPRTPGYDRHSDPKVPVQVAPQRPQTV